MDELIANFTAITSADPTRAQQYLSLTDGNLEQAIQLYFDSDGADMGATPAAAAAQAPTTGSASRTGYTEGPGGLVTIDDDDDDNQVDSSVRHGQAYEDDEAIARRMQEDMYSQGEQEQEVRAPMARTTETLVGPEADYYAGGGGGGGGGGVGGDEDDMNAAVMEQMMNRQRRGQAQV